MPSTLIEKTAIELAAATWEDLKMKGLEPKPANQRKFAKAHLEHFIPKAVEILTQMLDGGYSEDTKMEIYAALIERVNHKPTVNGKTLELN